MKLPSDIKRQLVSYLRLEYGEDDGNPAAIRAADLRYVGSRNDGAATVHYWEYPAGPGIGWVTAQVAEDECALSTSLTGPNGETVDAFAALRTLLVEFGCRSKGQKRIEPLRLKVSELGDEGAPVRFPSGEEISFYAEVHLPKDGGDPDVSVQVLQEGDLLLAVRCTSGVVISCRIAGYDCLLRLGTGPWG